MKRRIFLTTAIVTTATIAGCSTSNGGTAEPSENDSTEDKDSEQDTEDKDSEQDTESEEDDETVPKGTMRTFSVENGFDEEIKGIIKITNISGDVTGEASFSMKPKESYDNHAHIADKKGMYTAEVTVEGRGTVTNRFDYASPISDPHLTIAPADLGPNEDDPFAVQIDLAPDV
ncbi:hypothetical protein [Natrinema saccharevitans]|uniref:hypothetical protein n=1 Tax=Natrinema saccharevitans TaxID=301967 RepID=UPI0011154B1A|nr:hypothetical protein [Natrinema saccharevitans]